MESATDSAKREADRDTMAVEVERNRPTAAARRPPRILPAMFSKVTVPMRRFLGHHIFSSLTRRILFLNLAGLAVLVTGILYLNTFRDGLIDARVESLMTQGEIIAGAIAASATVETDAIRIDPEKLLELQAGESIGPSADQLDNLDFPINPERVAPVLRRLISPTRTRARIYDRDANLLLDSRHLIPRARSCATTCRRSTRRNRASPNGRRSSSSTFSPTTRCRSTRNSPAAMAAPFRRW